MNSSDESSIDMRESASPAQPDAPTQPSASLSARELDEATVSQLLASFWRSPSGTWRAVQMSARRRAAEASSNRLEQPSPDRSLGAFAEALPANRPLNAFALPDPRRLSLRSIFRLESLQLLAWTAAVVCALVGADVMRGTQTIAKGADSLSSGASWLWIAFFLWLAGEIAGDWRSLRTGWEALSQASRLRWLARIAPAIVILGGLYRFAQAMGAPRDLSVGMALSAFAMLLAGGLLWLLIEIGFRPLVSRSADLQTETSIVEREAMRPRIWREISLLRMGMALLAAGSSVYIWLNTSDNRIEPPVLLLWALNAALWCLVFAPLRWNAFAWASGRIDALRRAQVRREVWLLFGLAIALAAGAHLRLYRLHEMPREMHSDIVINILDAHNIHIGNDQRIFLLNNGGREPIFNYLYAAFAGHSGLGFNRYSVNLLAALQSLVTLPLMFWLAFEVMRGHKRRFAFGVALASTAMLAVSSWHIVMARQGLRIPLAPLFTTVSAVYFVRALRHNRRRDFVLAGLTLVLGLYSYKSVRMLPVVYVASVFLAMMVRRVSWRFRVRYLVNLGVLAFIACMIFVPMFHFWLEYPQYFTERMTSRMTIDSAANPEDPFAQLMEGGAILLGNMRNSALMFHFTADAGQVSGAPFEPAIDPVSAGLLLLGCAAWLCRMARSRDPVNWFVPCLLALMLLVPAFAIAFPVEVPHYQRSSPAMPAVFIILALPVALYCRLLMRLLPRGIGIAAAALFAALLFAPAYQYNHDLYFGVYEAVHGRSRARHALAGGILRGFVESDGGYGNAFIVASMHWWDHRAVGVESGVMDWPNSTGISDMPRMIRNGFERRDKYQLMPDKDLLFFYAQNNPEALPQLQTWFPAGKASRVDADWDDHSFYLYRAPAPGQQGMQNFVDQYG